MNGGSFKKTDSLSDLSTLQRPSFSADRGPKKLNERVLGDVMSRFIKAIPLWRDLLDRSFLSPDMRRKYSSLLDERTARLQL